jgi:LacI family transcriptional regulator
MATLQDIAERVGVSTVTVSKVLRGKIKGTWAKSAERVKKIHRVAEELGYQVDWRARALKTKRTNMVGLLSTNRPETRTHHPDLLAGLVEAMGEAGYDVVFYRVRSGGAHFADARFDGVIIDYHIEPEEIALIEQAQLPAVIVNAPSVAGIASVMPKHVQAGQLAAKHLLQLGHRRIGYLQPTVLDGARWPTHMYRMWRDGIRRAMTAANLVDGFVDVIPADIVSEQGPIAFVPQLRELMHGKRRPTALIANSPGRAMEMILNPLRDLGFEVPGDVSVLSMGDEPALRWVRPQVSALSIDFRQLGIAAAKSLLSQIDNDVAPSAKNRAELEESYVELRARHSTTAPPTRLRSAGSKERA